MKTELTWFRSRFWSETIFRVVIGCCLVFVAATGLAMFFYPGGRYGDPASGGYSFFGNFFSDLGRTVALDGKANPAGTRLFTLGLSAGGVGLILFFIGFRQFFQRELWLGCIATSVGMLAGMGFIGVALTPSDISGPAHGQYVLWAFRCFMLAAVLFAAAIYRTPAFPRGLAFIFIGFAALLEGYLVLLVKGPPLTSLQGVTIQVVGQKVIAYASVACVVGQSYAALRLNHGKSGPKSNLPHPRHTNAVAR